MRERLQSWLTMLVDKWKELTKSQKIKVSAIGGIVLFALVVTLVLALRTNWTPAFDGVDAATIGALEEVLNEEGIRTNANVRMGRVYVPANQLDDAWITAQISPVMLQDRFTFSRAIEESGMGVTQTMQHHQIMRARETEIEDTLMRLAMISHADVLLAQPNTPMLIAQTVPTTATITVRGSGLRSEDGLAIALIASRAVDGLNLEGITVINGDNLTVLFDDGEVQQGGSGAGSATSIFEMAERARLQADAQRILTASFDRAEVGVNMRRDWRNVVQEIITNSNPVQDGEGIYAHMGLISEEQLREIGAINADGSIAWEPGAMANDFPGGPLFGEDLGDNFMAMFENETVRRYIHDTVHRIETIEPGSTIAEGASITATVTRYIAHNQANLITMGLIEEGDAAWLLYQTEMGGETPFMNPDADYTMFETQMQMTTGIETVSLIVWYINVFQDIEPPAPLPLNMIVLLALVVAFIAVIAFGLIRRTQPAPIEDIEPELSVEDLLVSSQLADAQEAERARLEAIRHNQDSAVKEQIDKFVEEKPEAVAQLLRNWINDEWE